MESGACVPPRPFPREVRERAVRLVLEQRGKHATQWAAICAMAAKIGCLGEMLRSWVRQTERDRGGRVRADDSRERAGQGPGTRGSRTATGQRDPAQGIGLFCDGGVRPPTQAMIAFIDQHRRGRADRACSADRPIDLSRACRVRVIRSGCRPASSAMPGCVTTSGGYTRRTSAPTACARSGASCSARVSRSPDAFARRIVGWRVSRDMKSDFILDALEQAQAITPAFPRTATGCRRARSRQVSRCYPGAATGQAASVQRVFFGRRHPDRCLGRYEKLSPQR